MIALLLDLSNIVGGFLLALGLLARVPRVGDDVARAGAAVAPFGWIVGVVALVAGGYYLVVHLTSGPHVFHFEVVAIAVGVALLWGRLVRRRPAPPPGAAPLGAPQRGGPSTTLEGGALLLAVLGVIAILVGVQGLFTPD